MYSQIETGRKKDADLKASTHKSAAFVVVAVVDVIVSDSDSSASRDPMSPLFAQR